jgi:hypothetical protein
VIAATVLALRGDCAAARKHAARALAAVDPAESGLVVARARRALGVAALADGSYRSYPKLGVARYPHLHCTSGERTRRREFLDEYVHLLT